MTLLYYYICFCMLGLVVVANVFAIYPKAFGCSWGMSMFGPHLSCGMNIRLMDFLNLFSVQAFTQLLVSGMYFFKGEFLRGANWFFPILFVQISAIIGLKNLIQAVF